MHLVGYLYEDYHDAPSLEHKNFDPVCHLPSVLAFVFDGGNLRLIVRTLACI